MDSTDRRIRFGIQARVLAMALALSLPALLLVGWLSLNRIASARDSAVEQSEAALLRQAEATLRERAIDKAELYDRILSDVQQRAVAVSEVAVQSFSTPRADLQPPRLELFWLAGRGPVANAPDDLKPVLAQAQRVSDALRTQVKNTDIIDLGYMGLENGVLVFNDSTIVTKLPEGFDGRQRDWYRQAVAAGKPIWTGTYVDAVTGKLATTTAVPVYISGRMIGVVGMDLLLTTIQSDVLRLSDGSQGYAFLLDGAGKILVRPQLQAGDIAWNQAFKTDNWLESTDPAIREVGQQMINRQSGVVRVKLDQEDRYLAYAPMETTGWVVGLSLPIDEVIAPAQSAAAAIQLQQDRLRSNLLLLIIIMSIAIVLLALTLASTLTRPLRKLEEGARRVASGELDYQITVKGEDEIGHLGASFAQMTAALRDKLNELELNAHQMAQVNQVSNELKRLMSLGAVLDQIPVLLCKRLGFDRAALYLVREDRLEVVSASFGPDSGDALIQFLAAAQSEPIMLDGNTIEASVVRSRQAVIVDNPWDNPQVLQRKQAAAASNSYVQAPVVGREKVLGVISADYHGQQRQVTVQDASLLLTFAAVVGLTIENAFSFQNLEDLVEQRTAELRDALDRAQAADRLKSQFLASVSHELRTPLNAIIGFSTVLLDELEPVLEEAQREDLETINNNGRYLLDLINDILDRARIEAGKMTLHREPTAVRPVIDGAVEMLRALMRDKPVTLRVDVSPDLPPADADPTRLRQILINLLSNALKFTDKGHIVVRAQRRIFPQPALYG
ncbi:MAG TPA: cache domain-containing protein, partial [Herpetosiphonaceae bacterium]